MSQTVRCGHCWRDYFGINKMAPLEDYRERSHTSNPFIASITVVKQVSYLNKEVPGRLTQCAMGDYQGESTL